MKWFWLSWGEGEEELVERRGASNGWLHVERSRSILCTHAMLILISTSTNTSANVLKSWLKRVDELNQQPADWLPPSCHHPLSIDKPLNFNSFVYIVKTFSFVIILWERKKKKIESKVGEKTNCWLTTPETKLNINQVVLYSEYRLKSWESGDFRRRLDDQFKYAEQVQTCPSLLNIMNACSLTPWRLGGIIDPLRSARIAVNSSMLINTSKLDFDCNVWDQYETSPFLEKIRKENR